MPCSTVAQTPTPKMRVFMCFLKRHMPPRSTEAKQWRLMGAWAPPADPLPPKSMTGGFLRPGGWWSRDDKKQHKVIAREQCGPGSWRSAPLGLCDPQRLYLRRAPNILPTSARAVCGHRSQGRACAERPVAGGALEAGENSGSSSGPPALRGLNARLHLFTPDFLPFRGEATRLT